VLLDWNETVFANAISKHLLLPGQLVFYVSGHLMPKDGTVSKEKKDGMISGWAEIKRIKKTFQNDFILKVLQWNY